MALNIKNKATVSKVRRLAKLRGKGLTEVVDEAVSRELQRLRPSKAERRIDMFAALRQIQRDYAAGPRAAAEPDDGKIDAEQGRERRRKAIEASIGRIKSLPDLSAASEEEILGYNDEGLFD